MARTPQTVLSAAKLLGRYTLTQTVRGRFLDAEGSDGSRTNAAEFGVPKRSELEPNHIVVVRDGNPAQSSTLGEGNEASPHN